MYTVDSNKVSLSLKEILVYDGYEDENNPWFHGTREYYYDEIIVTIL